MVEPGRARGASLDRKKVLEAALAIADADGLEALSFRRLAAHFDVTPMALYRYVDSKEALLEGLGDHVLSEIELPGQAGDWREQLRATAHSLRSLLLAHPAVVPILLTRPLFTPAALHTADAVIGLLRRTGFPPAQAVLVYQQLARFLLALVTLETASGRKPTAKQRNERARIASMRFATLPREQFPNLVEAASHLAIPQEPDDAFEAGLDLLISGLENQLRATFPTARAVGTSRSAAVPS